EKRDGFFEERSLQAAKLITPTGGRVAAAFPEVRRDVPKLLLDVPIAPMLEIVPIVIAQVFDDEHECALIVGERASVFRLVLEAPASGCFVEEKVEIIDEVAERLFINGDREREFSEGATNADRHSEHWLLTCELPALVDLDYKAK